MGNQCSRKGENAISAKLSFKIFRGSTPPYPSSSSHLRPSRLGPPINLTLLRHCFHALTTDVTFTINCEILVNTCSCDLTQRLAFQILPRIYFSSGGVAGNVGVKKLTRLFEPSSGVVLERRIISNQKCSKGWLVLRYIALGWFIIMDMAKQVAYILQSSRQGHLNI